MPRAAATSKAKPPAKGKGGARGKGRGTAKPKPQGPPLPVFESGLALLNAPPDMRVAAMPRRSGTSAYRPEFCGLAADYMSYGVTLAGLAGLLGVSDRTIDNWVRAHPEFAEACASGRCKHVANLELQVSSAARGMWDPSKTQITALLASLNNLASSYWRQRKAQDDRPDPLTADPEPKDDGVIRIAFVEPHAAAA